MAPGGFRLRRNGIGSRATAPRVFLSLPFDAVQDFAPVGLVPSPGLGWPSSADHAGRLATQALAGGGEMRMAGEPKLERHF